jgi:nitrogenase molybdenum-iron protein alpha chain/nitrogenase molybdenum-cofactor synthesis protein NifE
MADGIDKSVVFYGHLSELYRLAKEGKINTKLQGSHTRPCKFWTATKILSGIKGAAIIAHGPSGCAYGVKQAYKLTNSRNSGSPYEEVISTSMDEKTVIYGGEKELKGAIQEVDQKYHPDAIFIATSCATGIIGDNVEAVVDKARSETGAELMTIHCEGFADGAGTHRGRYRCQGVGAVDNRHGRKGKFGNCGQLYPG